MKIHRTIHSLKVVKMSPQRRKVYFNPNASSWRTGETADLPRIKAFHSKLPGYQPSPLVPLKHEASDIGVGAIYVKEESSRFGLPSFKILGTACGAFQAITRKLGIPWDTDLKTVTGAVKSAKFKLYAATDGNHGRAVAWIGLLLGVPVQIHIPALMDNSTAAHISNEGAALVKSKGNYDDAISEAVAATESDPHGILIQDHSFEGYDDIPQV